MEKLQMWVAWHCPNWLVKWCAVRMFAHATTGPWSHEETPALLATTALQRWPAR